MSRKQAEYVIADLYREQPLPVDRLPYTVYFDNLHEELIKRTEITFNKHETWEMLQYLRRRKGRLELKSEERKKLQGIDNRKPLI